ncbi:uncharacterized protein LOC143430673 [Xylocopa sonorina]|uniref:uncharacterized protein LOC143430673 n=1 Tax=Xylocopa sonorina TaxID=1818115 RepID=UPI00403A921F
MDFSLKGRVLRRHVLFEPTLLHSMLFFQSTPLPTYYHMQTTLSTSMPPSTDQNDGLPTALFALSTLLRPSLSTKGDGYVFTASATVSTAPADSGVRLHQENGTLHALSTTHAAPLLTVSSGLPKASADRNSKHKEPSRRPSTSSLHHARSHMVQQKHQSPEKQPSTRNLAETCDSARMVSKAVDTCTPKTRFSSQDRCRESRTCFSPRLKYFPAEKIKKLEQPPPFTPKPIGAVIVQQDPQESGVLYVGTRSDQRCDNGQGDAAALAQQLNQYRQTPSSSLTEYPLEILPSTTLTRAMDSSSLDPRGMQTVSQQQVAPQQTSHQIGQMNPHSECALPQQVSNVQSHRPFVPHGSRDFSPRKNAHATFLNPSQVPASSQPSVQQVSNSSGSAVDRGKLRNDDQANDLDLDKQPIGGRNAALYRNVMTTSMPNGVDNMALNRSDVNNQRVQNQYFAQGHDTLYRSPSNPQQIYQQLQQNMAQQQQLQLRAMTYQQQMNGGAYNAQQFGRYIPGQGMAVPQDVAANQIQSTRMMGFGQPNYPVHQRDLNYTVNPQNGWMKNNQVAEYSSVKAQLKPFNVDVVNRNQPLYREQSQQQQFVPQYHQPATLYQQQPVQHQHRQLYRNSEQGNLTMQEHQNFMASDQSTFNQHTNFNNQLSPNQQPNPQQVSNNDPGVQSRKKKPLKFTVSMIRDQEKLLAAMRQQGVPMDIMRRQFEGLLNEQRRHLEYLEQIHQDDSQEVRRPVPVSRKRKEQDEKPEWMVHLTPPRLSYTEIEKMHEQRRRERELQQLQMMQQQQQHGINEMSDQQVPVQATNQQNYQHWQPSLQQQQQGTQQRYNNVFVQPQVVSGPGNANEPMKQTNYQPNVPRYQYVYQQPHQQSHQQTYQYPYQQPHQQYYNQQLQQYQQLYRPVSQPNRDSDQTTSHQPSYEENRPSTEPSSLLKLRLYKNEIRPQKRNNGLQDPEIARRQLEDLRVSAETRRGLEYLANLAAKKQQLKLNGMQERNDLEAEFQQRLITSGYQPPAKRVSANGLENSRDPNNPPPQRLTNLKKAEQEFLREYPRQKQTNSRNCYGVQAEKENDAVAVEQPQMYVQQRLPGQNTMAVIPCNERRPMMGGGNAVPFKFEENYPQHYQQMQQYYQNTRNLARNNGEGDVGSTERVQQGKGNFDHAGGDAIECVNGMMNGQMTEVKAPLQRTYYSQPNIHEARTIGGVRYLARKQDYLPSQQLVAPETLIGSRLVQPPMIY